MRRRALLGISNGNQPPTSEWSLFGQWDFQGNLLDSSGNNNNAILVGNATIQPNYLNCLSCGANIPINWNLIGDYRIELEFFFANIPHSNAAIWNNGGNSWVKGLFVGPNNNNWALHYSRGNNTYLFQYGNIAFTNFNWYRCEIIATNAEKSFDFEFNFFDVQSGNLVNQVIVPIVNITGYRTEEQYMYLGYHIRYLNDRPSYAYIRNVKMWIKNE